ncbi:hypothetical protein H0H92_003706 [Tricholoma furcatifolium]|nr:hypothetical protein H0H92_003706 [Tricholoma furcatifolium]
MFARLSAAILLALPVLALAGGCTTGEQTCCKSVEDANSPNVATLLGTLLGVAAQGVTGQVGLTCSPLTVVLASGVSCNAQTVCCENNNFNGIVALGCTPINVNL